MTSILCRCTSEDFELCNLTIGSKTITWSLDNPKLSMHSGQDDKLLAEFMPQFDDEINFNVIHDLKTKSL